MSESSITSWIHPTTTYIYLHFYRDREKADLLYKMQAPSSLRVQQQLVILDDFISAQLKQKLDSYLFQKYRISPSRP